MRDGGRDAGCSRAVDRCCGGEDEEGGCKLIDIFRHLSGRMGLLLGWHTDIVPDSKTISRNNLMLSLDLSDTHAHGGADPRIANLKHLITGWFLGNKVKLLITT